MRHSLSHPSIVCGRHPDKVVQRLLSVHSVQQGQRATVAASEEVTVAGGGGGGGQRAERQPGGRPTVSSLCVSEQTFVTRGTCARARLRPGGAQCTVTHCVSVPVTGSRDSRRYHCTHCTLPPAHRVTSIAQPALDIAYGGLNSSASIRVSADTGRIWLLRFATVCFAQFEPLRLFASDWDCLRSVAATTLKPR